MAKETDSTRNVGGTSRNADLYFVVQDTEPEGPSPSHQSYLKMVDGACTEIRSLTPGLLPISKPLALLTGLLMDKGF